MQKYVDNMLEKLDRPYLKYGTPGNTKNITGGIKKYFPPENLGFEVEEDHFNQSLSADLT